MIANETTVSQQEIKMTQKLKTIGHRTAFNNELISFFYDSFDCMKQSQAIV